MTKAGWKELGEQSPVGFAVGLSEVHVHVNGGWMTGFLCVCTWERGHHWVEQKFHP